MLQSATRAALLSFSVLACGEIPTPNLVLITLDTTRADHLGPYREEITSTPELDRFAQTAVVFEHAYSTAPWTLPAHASLLTGLRPYQHGADRSPEASENGARVVQRPLDARFDTLAERLGTRGYRTAAIVAGPLLKREFGMDQGFDLYDDAIGGPGADVIGRRAEVVSDRAIRAISGFGTDPYFLFVNYFDPHAPYEPPGGERAKGDATDAHLAHPLPHLMERLTSGAPFIRADEIGGDARRALDRFVEGYDDEIAYLDRHFGRLLAAIEETERPAFIAVTADHGESFGEHYFTGHFGNLYEPNVRVPLIVRYADGRGAGSRNPRVVQAHRLFGSVLAAAGFPPSASSPTLDDHGTHVVIHLSNNLSTVRHLGHYFDRDLYTIYDPPYKLIWSSQGSHELYDLARDPDELVDRSATEADRVSRMARQLEGILAAEAPLYDPRSGPAAVEPDTESMLRGLGYIE